MNGEERPVLRANYAFGAVRVGPGESTVELEYDPESLRTGGWISLASLAAAILLIGGTAFVRRRQVRSTPGATDPA